MKKFKLFISLWFTMFSIVVSAQAEFEKIAITQNTQDNTAGRLIVQDATTGELKYILKSVLDNKFNQPTGNATQYLDGAGNPTAFPVLGQADRVITEVRNTTGATVTKGTVVYLSGASGGKATIQKAQANSELTSSGTFGVIQSDINNNSNGYAVVIGTVLGVNTSSYTEGQVLWLSPTVAGGFTSTKPVAPNHAVYVAIVTLAATNGTIEVKVQNGYEIDELHDVLITSKANNDAIIYDSASGLWKNKQFVADAIVDGTTTVAPSQNAVFDALALKENTSNKNTANGYAGLGSDGKLISNQLPAITITDTFVVGSLSAMLALTAETGDVAVRTDLSKSFILKGSNAGTLADWQELLSPVDGVTSVFGRVGSVTANTGDYTTAQVTETTNKKYQTDAQALYNDATSSIQTQLNGKEPAISAPGTVGHYWRGNKTFATLDTSVVPENTQLYFTDARAKTAVTGNSGTTNYLSKFTASGTLGNSLIYDNGTNVGIGTTTPLTALTVSGNLSLFATNQFRLYNPAKNNWAEISSPLLGGDTEIDLKFVTKSGIVYINPSGNVGIGTTSPNRKLEISTTSNSIPLRLQTDGSNTGIEFLGGSGVYNFFVGKQYNVSNAFEITPSTTAGGNTFSTPALIVNSSGNVGIGTTSPSGKLEVNGSGYTSGLINATMTSGGGNVLRLNTNFSGGNIIDLNPFISGVSNGGFEISQNGTKRLVISDTGNVGIGTTSPSKKLDVNGTAQVSGIMSIPNMPHYANNAAALTGGLTYGDLYYDDNYNVKIVVNLN